MLEEKVLNTIKKYELIKNGDNIVIGVSGGPDSIALLNMLNNIKETLDIKIFVAHVNHMIRQEADEETKYVEEFCKKIGVKCFIKRSDIISLSKELKIGTEETGRMVRYNFFNEVLKNTCSNKIATAHNANDNAETLLMNIIRGCGLSGLRGIEPIRDEKIIRPIIECNRQEIEEYCTENKLLPKYDKSNKENIYTRNKIRNMLIPYIEKEFNPNIIEGLNRLSQVIRVEDKYLNEIIKIEYNNLVIEEDNINKQIILNRKEFNNLEKVIKSRIILYTINKVVGNVQGIEKVNIEDIIKLCENNVGNKFLKPNRYIKIYVKKDKIFFTSLA